MGSDSTNHRFTKRDLNERQIKSFKTMYEDSSYSIEDMALRFGVHKAAISDIAKDIGLPIRKVRG